LTGAGWGTERGEPPAVGRNQRRVDISRGHSMPVQTHIERPDLHRGDAYLEQRRRDMEIHRISL